MPICFLMMRHEVAAEIYAHPSDGARQPTLVTGGFQGRVSLWPKQDNGGTSQSSIDAASENNEVGPPKPFRLGRLFSPPGTFQTCHWWCPPRAGHHAEGADPRPLPSPE